MLCTSCLELTTENCDFVAVFKSRLKSQLSLLPLLTNTLPGPSASEVTTLWLYTNLFIIRPLLLFKTLSTKFPRVKY